MIQECKKHGKVEFYTFKDKGAKFGVRHRCKQCVKDAVAETVRKNKATLVFESGGKCNICGYNKYMGALHFHHSDPKTKEFGLSKNTPVRSLSRLRKEAAKCILLCANCHAEVEAGITCLPSK